ncbi:MAG: LOG family protein [Chloroflexota bacterium]
MRKVISVFGSSNPQPGSADYEQARQVGRFLAEAGFAVATGGYNGVMAAASQGAAEAGGHVIGVTSGRIEGFRPLRPNPWVKEIIHFDNLRDRVLHLVSQNQGMITLPGGIGTLSELAMAWSFIQVGEMAQVPLVVLGELWQNTLSGFIRPEYVRDGHAALLYFAPTPEAAVEYIKRNT